MTTTLNEARTALHRLSAQFPAQSTYADLLATLSDYFDNQVPLNIENRNLTQRIAVLEATIAKVRDALPEDTAAIANFVFTTPSKDPDLGNRRLTVVERAPIDCTAWMGNAAGACMCTACRVRSHA